MHAISQSGLLKQAEDLLMQNGAEEATLLRILDLALSHFQCAVGTLHSLDPKSGMLGLVVQRGLPEALLGKVRQIPIGKGMAGIAAQRKEPVQVCNLQSDDSGVVRPGARSTGMEGSIAVPMMPDARSLRGVLGVAKPQAYDFTPAETGCLLQLGALIARHLAPLTRTQLLDQYFMDARSKLIDIAAFLDRVQRGEGEEDFRIAAFRAALKELESEQPERARKVLLAFSDLSTEPIAEAPGKSACGAWQGKS